MKILITGSAGFISGYLVQELLNRGHQVVGLDNYSKYGKIKKSYDGHSHYTFVEGDAKNYKLLRELMQDCDQVVAAAAMVGGIQYFHKVPYDIISENEKIIATTFDAAVSAYRESRLEKVNLLSSSMVYENTAKFPIVEGDELVCRPPSSSYGFQKLAAEYFAKNARKQYGLPYTIIRPFNCVGIGEEKAALAAGSSLGHVVPDLIEKILRGQDPVEILGDGSQVRHYTFGGDLAAGIRMCIEDSRALNEDFNLSTGESTTVLDLAEKIWRKINPEKEFRCQHLPGCEYDVQKRVPAIEKAASVLGFRAETKLDEMLDLIIPWVREKMNNGRI